MWGTFTNVFAKEGRGADIQLNFDGHLSLEWGTDYQLNFDGQKLMTDRHTKADV